MAGYSDSRSYQRLSAEGRRRFDALAQLVQTTFSAEIRDCFVSEVIQEDGRTIYPSFVLFLDEGISECHNPMVEEHYDFFAFRGRLHGLDIRSHSYSRGQATAESRLTAKAYFSGAMGSTLMLQAAGEGCDELSRILADRLLPAMVKECR